jgi:hypothetical protein
LAREEAAPCLTDGIGSPKLRKNIGYNDGSAPRDSSGKHKMKFPQAIHAAVNKTITQVNEKGFLSRMKDMGFINQINKHVYQDQFAKEWN